MTPDNMNPSSPPSSEKAPRAPFSPWLLVAVAALALAGWQWIETRQKLADTHEQVARRLAEADAGSKEDRGALKQMREQIDGLQGKLGAADARLAEFQAQSDALQALYQDLARSRDESGLLEAEQAIALAAQQLQLAGNVPAAIIALRTAEARLASVDRPQSLPLRKALARDLERLTALPVVDIAGTSVRIEQVLVAIDKLPLAMDIRPQEASAKPATAAGLALVAAHRRRDLAGVEGPRAHPALRPRGAGAAGARAGLLPARKSEAAPAECPSGAAFA